jgi:predicted PurR-regulated permease PerM
MLIYILVYQQLESSYLSPAVYGKALSLPNALVFVAALIGGVLGGLLGALLAIPIAACIRVGFLAYFSAREQQHPA